MDGYIQSSCRLIGNQDAGVAGESHRDHGPLPLPAAHLMGVFVNAPFGIGDIYLVEYFNGPPSGSFLVYVLMKLNGFNYLISYGIHRI